MATHWLDISPEEQERTIRQLRDWHQAEIENLVKVIKGQHETLVDNGYWEVWCSDCDQSSESFRGSIEDAAQRFFKDGWAADSTERATAICKVCANRDENDADYAIQYRTDSGGIPS